MISIDIPSLLDGIYDAALDASLWPRLVGELVQTMRGSSGLLFTPQLSAEEGIWASHNISPEGMRHYVEHYHQHDIWTISLMSRFHGLDGVYSGDQLVPPDEFQRSLFYNEFLAGLDLRHLGTAAIGERTGQHPRLHLSIYRPARLPPFDDTELSVLALIGGHLRRAATIQSKVRVALDRRQSIETILDSLPSAMFLVDSSRRILHLNAAAAALLRRAAIFCSLQGRLVPRDPRLADFLDSAVTTAIRRKRASVHALADANGESFHVLVARLAPEGAGKALVIVVNRHAEPSLESSGLFTRLFGLTAAEARLALKLADGGGLKEAAAELQITHNTARTHLRHIFEKLDIDRQAQLVALLARLQMLVAPADPQ
jgi:DNA-binding CsgD family transcriptional regulator